MVGGTQKDGSMEEATKCRHEKVNKLVLGSAAQEQPYGNSAQGPQAGYCIRRDKRERVGHVQGTAGAWLQLDLRPRWQIRSTSPPLLLLFIVDVV